MKPETKQEITNSIQDFRLPRYNEIPNVGLYLAESPLKAFAHISPC